MRIAALDVGEVRVGIAVCDDLEMAAYPVATVRRVGNLVKDVAAVAAVLAEREAEMLVIGLPLSIDGGVGPQAARVQGFGKAMAKKTGLPHVYWDESLTSVEADQLMIEQGLSRAKRREQIDRVAAALILTSFLESRRKRTSEAAGS
jgi:putative Holliday junction resolvase